MTSIIPTFSTKNTGPSKYLKIIVMTDKINECQEFPKKYFALSYLFTSYSSFIIHFFNRNRTFFEYLMYIKRKNIPFFIFKFHIIIRNQQTSRWLDPRKKSIKISPPRIQLDRLKSAHSNCKKNIICRIFIELGARSCMYIQVSIWSWKEIVDSKQIATCWSNIINIIQQFTFSGNLLVLHAWCRAQAYVSCSKVICKVFFHFKYPNQP